ncbi:MAG TPA: hypothetical protein VK841_06565 [Polyangiaceae bacterium]|jgi:hypothetical protein|nr:hypothetical protein [Polyangiaceae bacterium]
MADKKATPAADSKFAQFIAEKKLDPRRILIASYKLESLQPEDRLIRLNRRQAKKAKEAGGASTEAKEAPKKPRSGRPVTDRAMAAALKGAPVSGPTKSRFVRAVNHLLEQKKQAAIDIRALF